MSAPTVLVWYGPLCTYDCLTGQVEIFWVGDDWHDEDFCKRYEAVVVRAIWLLAGKMMLCCLVSSLQRRRPTTCNLYSVERGTMGRHARQGNRLNCRLLALSRMQIREYRRAARGPSLSLARGRRMRLSFLHITSAHVHIYNDHTLISPSLPPLTRYLSQNLILSTGLTCPLTTSFLCSPDVRL
jgi:hypothetical protein